MAIKANKRYEQIRDELNKIELSQAKLAVTIIQTRTALEDIEKSIINKVLFWNNHK